MLGSASLQWLKLQWLRSPVSEKHNDWAQTCDHSTCRSTSCTACPCQKIDFRVSGRCLTVCLLHLCLRFLLPKVLLEQLPTVGDVTVVRGMSPEGFSHGFTWTVTFETQTGNLEPMFLDGNSSALPIVGPNAKLSVTEVRRGVSPSLDVDITGLEPGTTYVTRVSARNAAGYGPTTIAGAEDGGYRGSNNVGLGIAPFGIVTRKAPSAPLVAGVTAISASQLEVLLETPTESPGVNVLGYKARNRVDVFSMITFNMKNATRVFVTKMHAVLGILVLSVRMTSVPAKQRMTYEHRRFSEVLV